jgi:hypothetical protein
VSLAIASKAGDRSTYQDRLRGKNNAGIEGWALTESLGDPT